MRLIVFSLFLVCFVEAKDLSSHPYWHKLLHIENGKTSIKGGRFFLSKTKNPRDELMATLHAFRVDSHMKCRFRTRYLWLKKYYELGELSCEDDWFYENIRSLSLVFTSARFFNAGTSFGHSFLKLQTKNKPIAIDYSVDLEGDPFAVYAYKGLFGGYSSHYNIRPYSTKQIEYIHNEFRNIYAFDINLSKQEIERIVSHVKELNATHEDYYFANKNCASEIIKLVELANENLDLSSGLDLDILPIETIEILHKKGLIELISTVEPSKKTIAQKHFQNLNDYEKEFFHKLLSFAIGAKELKDKLGKKSHKILLAALFEITTSKTNSQKPSYLILETDILKELKGDLNILDPHTKRQVFSMSFKKRRFFAGYDKDVFFSQYRYVYKGRYDLIDDEPVSGGVAILDLGLSHTHNDTMLDFLHIFDIDSFVGDLNSFNQTKRLRLGFDRIWDNSLQGNFDYSLGYRSRLSFVNLYMSAHASFLTKEIFAPSVEVGGFMDLKRRAILEASYQARFFSLSQRHENLFHALLHIKLLDLNIVTGYKHRGKKDGLFVGMAMYF